MSTPVELSSSGQVSPSHEMDCDKNEVSTAVKLLNNVKPLYHEDNNEDNEREVKYPAAEELSDDVKVCSSEVNNVENEAKQDPSIKNGNSAHGGCSTDVNEPDQAHSLEDDIDAQAASSTDEGREIPEQANINDSPLLLIKKVRTLLAEPPRHPPEVYQQLCAILLEHFVNSADSENRNVPKEQPSDVEIISSEKVMATATSLLPEMVGRQAADLTYVKTLERKLADLTVKVENQGKEIECLKNRNAQHDRCGVQAESVVAYQGNVLEQLQRDCHRFKIEIQALKQIYMQTHTRITQLHEAIIELNRNIEFNEQRTETLAHRVHRLSAEVTAYLSLVDVQSVD